MDTTPKYIKMCEKAEKIQRKWKILKYHKRICDIYWDGKDICYGSPFQHYNWNKIPKGSIWLPRQDQLQEMVKNKFSTREILPCLYVLIDFIKNKDGIYDRKRFAYKHKSWEQLWLAFVMHELYLKQWDDKKEEWIT